MAGPKPENVIERPSPALRTLAVLETAKGALAFAASCGLVSLRHTDLHAAIEAFLVHHRIDPEKHYTRMFIDSLARASNHHVGQIAAFGFVYALIRVVEGYGLWQGKHWAEWFAAISAGLYLPYEIHHFVHHPRLFSTGVILLNIALVAYLGKLLAQQSANRHARH
jgi:uncharacterized membrane protein (DUF2068 family)